MYDPEQIEVGIETQDDAVIISPTGDIDLSRAPSLRTQLGAAQANGPGRMVINLSEVPYMDSSGVATLVEAMQIARKSGTTLVLCAMQERVRSIFEIARLDMVFKIVDSKEDALIA